MSIDSPILSLEIIHVGPSNQEDNNCVLVQNKTWKKYTVGRGNAAKSDILEYANIFWHTQFAEQDWADAACIALWCRLNVTGETT